MMSKLKKQNVKSKVSSTPDVDKCPQNVSFSMEHLTKNKQYNFDFFSDDTHRKINAKAAVYDRLEELSKNTWLYWNGLSKNQGCETLKCDRIRFSPSGYIFTNDEKVIVFRFSFLGSDCRILGIKKSPCSVFYIIGFDFDHSAYDHGS